MKNKGHDPEALVNFLLDAVNRLALADRAAHDQTSTMTAADKAMLDWPPTRPEGQTTAGEGLPPAGSERE